MSTRYRANGKDRVDSYPEQAGDESRSVADLIKDLRDESLALVREEVSLAKTEMKEKASIFGRNAALLIVGGAVAHLGLIFLLLAGSAGLERFYDSLGLWFHGDWIAPLVVGLIVGTMGAVMVLKAKETIANTSLTPKHTQQSLKEDKQWLQAKTQ